MGTECIQLVSSIMRTDRLLCCLHQMEAFEMDEREVLKGITKVYSARRAAAMRVAEEAARRGDDKSLQRHAMPA